VNVDGGPGFVGGVTDVFEWTLGALGHARDAEGTSVMNNLVGEVDPFVLREDAHEVLLDLDRLVVLREFEAAGDAVHVGVYNDADGFAEPGAEDDIGGLAGGAGNSEEPFHVVGYLSGEIVNDYFCGSDDGFGFVAEESRGLDVGLELLGSECGEVLGRWVLLEDDGCDHVYAGVGALGGEDGGDE
jgi:hypothetical protein